MEYMLSAIVSNPKAALDGSFVDLYKELRQQSGEAEQLKIITAYATTNFPIGIFVEIIGTDYVGEVIEYNKRLGGFYPGIRYPIHIKITHTTSERFKEVVGRVFEYSFDNVVIIDANTLAFNDVLNDYPPRENLNSQLYDNTEYLKLYNDWKLVG